MSLPRFKLIELLGAYSVTPTPEVDAFALREKVNASDDFTKAERLVLLDALDATTQHRGPQL